VNHEAPPNAKISGTMAVPRGSEQDRGGQSEVNRAAEINHEHTYNHIRREFFTGAAVWKDHRHGLRCIALPGDP